MLINSSDGLQIQPKGSAKANDLVEKTVKM